MTKATLFHRWWLMIGPSNQDKDFPYWLVLLVGLIAWMSYRVAVDDLYSQVLGTLTKGIQITISVTLIGFLLAAAAGLLLAIMSLSKSMIARQIARFL